MNGHRLVPGILRTFMECRSVRFIPSCQNSLRRQLLTGNEVQGIGQHVIANLNRKGVCSPLELNEQIRWVAGIGLNHAGELLHWRPSREGFFHFDPASVTAAETAVAINAHDQKVLAQLQPHSAEVSQHALAARTWQVLDEVLAPDIRAKLVEVEQLSPALQSVEKLWT